MAKHQVTLWNGRPNAARVAGEQPIAAVTNKYSAIASNHRPLTQPDTTPRHFAEAYRETAAGHVAMCRCGWDGEPAGTLEEARQAIAQHLADPTDGVPLAAVAGHSVQLETKDNGRGERLRCVRTCGWMSSRTYGDTTKAAAAAREHVAIVPPTRTSGALGAPGTVKFAPSGAE